MTTTLTAPASADIRVGRGTPKRRRRASVAVLLIGTAVLYLVGLSASGYANSFYSAAAQAGSQSWKAFFFGSLDAGNAITVDKPPGALWLMALSVRLFGLSSWSILAPQALLGVAAIGTLYVTVRRVVGHWPGMLAGAVFALTPVATLMFRFNNPDAMLVLVLALAAYATLRATERGSARWLALAGALVGFGFLTKMLQAFLVLPALGLVYLVAAPVSLGRRIRHLLLACGTMIIAAGWWVAIVELTPAAERPYIGGSQHNSVLELIFGYNGFGRLTGNEVGSVTGGGGGMPIGGTGGMWGQTGLTRMFTSVSGGMVSWLIPAALIVAVGAFVVIGRASRLDRRRAGLIMMLTWLVVTAATFSFMAGIYHDYYTVALAPGIAGTLAIGGAVLWRARHRAPARMAMAVATVATAVWAFYLLSEAPEPYAALRWPVLIVGLVASAGLVVVHALPRMLATLIVVLALGAGMAGPTAYALNTAATPHTGSIVTAGPVSDRGGPGGGMTRGVRRPGGAGMPPGGPSRQPGGTQHGQPGRQPGGWPDGGRGTGDAGMGGLLDGGTVSTRLQSLLLTGADGYTWVAAAIGSQSAASYQLATGYPVMAIGGFNGSDPSPTLAQFQQLVAQGRIHYFVGGGQAEPNGGSRAASQIASWVRTHYTATTVGGTTVYDLSQAAS